MPFIPKFPEGCRHLNLALVSRTLAKHRLDLCAAAKELGVSQPDLRRLTWHDPKLLDEAKEACDLYANRCYSLMVQALSSSNRQKREWAAEAFLASPFAHGSPFSPAPSAPRPRPKLKSNKPLSEFFLEIHRQRALKKMAQHNDALSHP
jgi:hypothetical protein